MSIILGVDPGSRITGYGLISTAGSRCEYVASGCIRITADDLVQRLQQVYAGLSDILSQYQPSIAAIEQVFFHQNPNSALKLGQARGAAIVAIGYYGITDLAEYSARQIKQAVVGYGGAEKSQVQLMVKNLLRLSDIPQADAADALAITLCCAQHQRWSAVTDLKKEKTE